MSSFRIRFRFNQQKGGSTTSELRPRGFENFARVIVEDFAVSYGDKMFDLLKRTIQERTQADIERELDHMAKLFMARVVGIAGRNQGPTGELTTVAPLSEAMQSFSFTQASVRSLTGNWPRRSPFYMQSRKWAGDSWFHRTGGSLAPLRSAKTWTGAFGGITVSVNRHTSLNRKDLGSTKLVATNYSRNTDTKIAIATIRVQAMTRITPGMLPALGGGGLGDFGSNARGSGLLAMLGERVAWRLGGNPQTVPFRPTIQPFLGYFLTRAMPNAVFKRIEQGFQGQRWKWEETHGAGRTR